MSELLFLVAFIIFITSFFNMSARIRVLEKKVATWAPTTSSPTAVPTSVPIHTATTSAPVATHTMPRAAASEQSSQLGTWLKENWLSKLGVLLILIGFGWFISYAFVHNWIGPVGRVALGMILGAVLCALGAWRIAKDSVQANIFLVLGSAIVMMTGYAARVIYDFFSPETILLLSAFVAVYIGTLAVKYNRENLAVYGTLVALVAPLFTYATDPSVVGLYLYLAVVSIASVAVSMWRSFGGVNVAALYGVLLYAAPMIFGLDASITEPDKIIVVVILSLLSLMYFVVNIFDIVRRGESIERNAVLVAIGNSLLIFGVVTTLVVEELRSLMLAGWMIIFAAGSLYVSANLKKQTFFYIYALIAIFFLGVATTIELAGPVRTIAFMLEGAIIVLLTYTMTKKLQNSAYMALIMCVPALATANSLNGAYWEQGILHADAFVVLLMSVLLFVLGYFFIKQYRAGVDSPIIQTVYIILSYVGAYYAFSYIWLASHALWQNDIATIASLTVYTVVGVVTYLQGAFTDGRPLKRFGSVVLVLVILRLVLIDVWAMPLAPRIVTFILIGILLVSTSFIGRKKLVATQV
jgi:uncharacterized membrane protein